MVNTLVLALALQTPSPAHFLIGSYQNSAKDVTIALNGVGYDMAVGRPLSLKQAQRHVDFESGTMEFSKGKLVLTRSFLLHSPNRSDYNALIGGGLHRGYQRIYITPEERKQFLSELKWRVEETPSKRYIGLRYIQRHFQFVVGGVLLTETPAPK